MGVVTAIVGLLVGGSIIAMLWLSVLALLRRWTRGRIERQADKLRALLDKSRQAEHEGLDKLLFEMRDTFDPDVLDAQLQVELGAKGDSGHARHQRLVSAVQRLGLVDRYLVAVRDAPSWRKRAQAAHALGAIGDHRAAEPLVLGMRDTREDRDVKLACAEALGGIKDPAVIPLLCEQLGQVDEWSSPRIAAILTKFGSLATSSLLVTLDQGESLNARVWAAQILGKSKARDSVPALRDRLHDRSEQMRLSAANALGEIGDIRAVRSLIDVALRDPTSVVRAQAAQGLGKLGDAEALPILVSALGDPEYWMRFRALEAIEQLHPEDLEPVESALTDSSPEVRRRAALALERLGKLDESFAALSNSDAAAEVARERLTAVGRAGLSERFVRHLHDDNALVRENTAHILGGVGDPNHASELVSLLGDSEAGVKRAAAKALGSLGVGGTVRPLISLLDDSDPMLADVAEAALHRFPAAILFEDIDRLAAVLGSESDTARVRAANVLVELPGEEIDELLLARGLGDRFVEVRLAAVRGLGARRVERAVDAIGALLSDPYEPLRVASAAALSDIGGSRAIGLLLARMPRAGRSQREEICAGIAALGFSELGGALDILLGSPDVNARIGATWVLGNTESAEAVPLLAALLADSESRVRSSASGALAKIDIPLAVAALRSAHNDPNQFVRAAVVNAIGTLGDSTDVEILRERSDDPDPFVRNRALIAVARVAGEQARAVINAQGERGDMSTRVIALGQIGDAKSVGEAMAALGEPGLRDVVAAALTQEIAPIRDRFVANLGLASAPEMLRDSFQSSLEPSPMISQIAISLRNSNSSEERLRALEILSRLEVKEATLALAGAVRHDPSPTVRAKAAFALASRIEDEDAERVLIAAVSDPDADVRAVAIGGLGATKDPRHGPLLRRALGSADEVVAAAAVHACSQLYGQDSASLVDWMMGRESAAERSNVMAVLGRIGNPENLPLIASMAVDSEASVRMAAVLALAGFAHLVAERAIVARISDPDSAVRRVAIAAAPLSADTVDALSAATADPNVEVRRVCAARLGDSSQREAISLLEKMASDPDQEVVATSLVALLGNRQKESRRAFLRVASKAGTEALANTVARSGAAISVVAVDVGSALSTENRTLSLQVLIALRHLSLADDIAVGLSDLDPTVRLEAARGLVELDVDKLDDRLRELLDDPVQSVRSEVRRLLIRSV